MFHGMPDRGEILVSSDECENVIVKSFKIIHEKFNRNITTKKTNLTTKNQI